MFGAIARKLIGTRNDRVVKRLSRTAESITALEPELEALDDDALRARTEALREQRAGGATADDVLVEAFALVREAGKRALGMRHFDVQLIGGMVLNQSRIAEMRTGEGKTLVATLPIYLNALAGEGAHLVTVNDYLARRDAAWMGRLYHFLGMSTGVINGSGGLGPDSASYLFDPAWTGEEGGYLHLRPVTRREAYAADITYGTNNEFGFDYLRDNMRMSNEERCQRDLHFALVDEVDSILIDEARTPLIISGPATASEDLYGAINALIPKLDKPANAEDEGADYTLDEKGKQVLLTESGHDKVEQLMIEAGLIDENASLYDPTSISLLHHLGAALRAHAIYTRDVDYIVKDDQIVIVDEFTGRTMPGRRWSDGLHQAVEAKEGVSIQAENQTVASITFQNYFRLYDKLGGMTGTADTEAAEFQQIYNLEVVVVPTHREMVRDDRPDLVYLTQEEKYGAIIEDVEGCVAAGRPVLVGTASIESSELVADLLKNKGIPHQVLNAKQPEREANIIAEAGRPGVVTIATNMAGRGTDIVLGGNLDSELDALGSEASDADREALRSDWTSRHQRVLDAGGLHIIASERHESRRIDNQLRGRAGRQGDPGSSRFYLSLQDNLMRIFASDRVAGLMQKLGMEEGEAIEHPWVTKAIENAQRKVEAHNFDIRKHLLEYDDVANDQRKVIYEQRNDLLGSDDMGDAVIGIREDVVAGLLADHIPPDSLDEQWDVPAATQAFREQFLLDIDIQAWLDADESLDEDGIRERLVAELAGAHQQKTEMVGAENMQRFEKFVLLRTLDDHWREHLAAMDHLRQSVGLRGYAQKNPKQEYKRESFELFSSLLDAFQREAISTISRVQIRDPAEVEAAERAQRVAAAQQAMQYQHAQAASALDGGEAEAGGAETGQPAQGARAAERPRAAASEPGGTPYVRNAPKLGRNEPCFCGSGKKFKQCHGKLN
ncbi:MAG: preprotein translocase subunit SecA [Pseudomonadota bacterium]